MIDVQKGNRDAINNRERVHDLRIACNPRAAGCEPDLVRRVQAHDLHVDVRLSEPLLRHAVLLNVRQNRRSASQSKSRAGARAR